MKQGLAVLSLVAVILSLGSPGEAIMITYSDKGDFLSDTGAASATGPLPNVGPVLPGHTVGDVSFTTLSGRFFIGTGSADEWSSLIPGPDIAISGAESFLAELAAPVFALGFDFHEPTKFTGAFPDDCFAPCFDSTFEVTLLSAGVDIPGATFMYDAPDAALAFVGVWTDFAFDGARIIDVTDTIDDEFWGEFYTGTAEAPEPSSLVLFASGLAALLVHRRRRY